jgi:uncharacterized protein (TIGR02145 family)
MTRCTVYLLIVCLFFLGLPASVGERQRLSQAGDTSASPATDDPGETMAASASASGAVERQGIKKKPKKFPWLLAGTGAVAVATVVLLLTGKKNGSGNPNGNIEYGTVTDIDGNVYRTVRIGSQWWMAENLRATRYSDGTPIESYIYDDDEANLGAYGRMYRWTATMRLPAGTDSIPARVQGAAPAGWHIPTDAEWRELTNALGGEAAAGGKLKENGTAHWNSPNSGATNESGFTAVPSGYRGFGTLGYYNKGTRCLMAVAVGYSGWPTARELKSASAAISGAGMHPDDAISVRCVRD